MSAEIMSPGTATAQAITGIGRRRRPAPALAGLVLAALLAGVGSPPRAAAQATSFVVITTDDQTAAALADMPKTLALLAGHGTRFTDATVPTATCAPSRAAFLTGQYPHNNGVIENPGAYQALDHTRTLAVWLQNAGYHTTMIGKYLHDYSLQPLDIPPGWNDWQVIADAEPALYGYTLNDNGTLVTYGDAEADYQTDVIADRAVRAINARADAGQRFFLWLAPTAPHLEPGLTGPRPAPRHAGRFADRPLPKPPSFDEADVSDKPSLIRAQPRIDAAAEAAITQRYRNRQEALLAVDDLVERVVSVLNARRLLATTTIIFTSDNGFMLGEHRLQLGKNNFYDEALRVPLLIRGPRFAADARFDLPVSSIDLTQTIVLRAGAVPDRVLDGRNLLQLIAQPSLAASRTLLVQRATPTPAAAIRTRGYVFTQYSGSGRELYDRAADPWELDSRHADPAFAAVRTALASRLNRLRTCAGPSCRSVVYP
jgi:arylsulfatase A-like enzyme